MYYAVSILVFLPESSMIITDYAEGGDLWACIWVLRKWLKSVFFHKQLFPNGIVKAISQKLNKTKKEVPGEFPQTRKSQNDDETRSIR